jgi:hypothetical protein
MKSSVDVAFVSTRNVTKIAVIENHISHSTSASLFHEFIHMSHDINKVFTKYPHDIHYDQIASVCSSVNRVEIN